MGIWWKQMEHERPLVPMRRYCRVPILTMGEAGKALVDKKSKAVVYSGMNITSVLAPIRKMKKQEPTHPRRPVGRKNPQMCR